MTKFITLLRRLFGEDPDDPPDEAEQDEERKRIVETMLMGRSCCG